MKEEEQLYRDYFNSKLEYEYGYHFDHALSLEEEKWVKRAEWLDSIIDAFRGQRSTFAWVPWFEAKFSQLSDLDVPIKNGREEKSKHVFYLFNFLEDSTTKKDLKDHYHNEMKTQVEFQTEYPQLDCFLIDGGCP
jgi:hypothetical protein